MILNTERNKEVKKEGRKAWARSIVGKAPRQENKKEQ